MRFMSAGLVASTLLLLTATPAHADYPTCRDWLTHDDSWQIGYVQGVALGAEIIATTCAIKAQPSASAGTIAASAREIMTEICPSIASVPTCSNSLPSAGLLQTQPNEIS